MVTLTPYDVAALVWCRDQLGWGFARLGTYFGITERAARRHYEAARAARGRDAS